MEAKIVGLSQACLSGKQDPISKKKKKKHAKRADKVTKVVEHLHGFKPQYHQKTKQNQPKHPKEKNVTWDWGLFLSSTVFAY
jgi:hypothetical protein